MLEVVVCTNMGAMSCHACTQEKQMEVDDERADLWVPLAVRERCGREGCGAMCWPFDQNCSTDIRSWVSLPGLKWISCAAAAELGSAGLPG